MDSRPQRSAPPRGPRARTVRGDVESPSVACFVVVVGAQAGAKYPLPTACEVIGRSHDATIVLQDPEVSRNHATVTRSEAGDYAIQDTASANGTYVDGERITSRELRPGDRVQVGGHVLLFTHHTELQKQIMERQRLEALGRIAAGVVHDFNNMLAVVLANADTVLAMPPDTRNGDTVVTECLADIREAASHAHDLARRWLTFGRSRSTGYERVDLTRLCGDVTDLLRASIPRTIEISCEVQPGLWVIGDSGQLHQILVNLMINARDAMPEGGVLQIRATRLESAAEPTLCLSVVDNGSGMDEATREQIFLPFFSTKLAGGFGLGLATVHESVRAHGGQVTVHSEQEVGTTFEIVLPCLPDEAPVRPAPSLPPLVARRDQRALVLVIDDEQKVRRAAQRVLTSAGHEVIEAENGREGIKRLLEHERVPDLVLLDLEMPVLDGTRTLALLLKIEPTLRVIICAALAHDRWPELLALGAAGLLPKPFGGADLLRTVEQAFEPALGAEITSGSVTQRHFLPLGLPRPDRTGRG